MIIKFGTKFIFVLTIIALISTSCTVDSNLGSTTLPSSVSIDQVIKSDVNGQAEISIQDEEITLQIATSDVDASLSDFEISTLQTGDDTLIQVTDPNEMYFPSIKSIDADDIHIGHVGVWLKPIKDNYLIQYSSNEFDTSLYEKQEYMSSESFFTDFLSSEEEIVTVITQLTPSGNIPPNVTVNSLPFKKVYLLMPSEKTGILDDVLIPPPAFATGGEIILALIIIGVGNAIGEIVRDEVLKSKVESMDPNFYVPNLLHMDIIEAEAQLNNDYIQGIYRSEPIVCGDKENIELVDYLTENDSTASISNKSDYQIPLEKNEVFAFSPGIGEVWYTVDWYPTMSFPVPIVNEMQELVIWYCEDIIQNTQTEIEEESIPTEISKEEKYSVPNFPLRYECIDHFMQYIDFGFVNEETGKADKKIELGETVRGCDSWRGFPYYSDNIYPNTGYPYGYEYDESQAKEVGFYIDINHSVITAITPNLWHWGDADSFLPIELFYIGDDILTIDEINFNVSIYRGEISINHAQDDIQMLGYMDYLFSMVRYYDNTSGIMLKEELNRIITECSPATENCSSVLGEDFHHSALIIP